VRISSTGRAFVDLVHGLADQADLDHRAQGADEAGVAVPPLVESSGAAPVTSATAAATRSVNGPRSVRNASPLIAG
jgi:hypothetical protein